MEYIFTYDNLMIMSCLYSILTSILDSKKNNQQESFLLINALFNSHIHRQAFWGTLHAGVILSTEDGDSKDPTANNTCICRKLHQYFNTW